MTDVEGVYTANPSIAPKAKKIEYITYEEMLEMSSLGALVNCIDFMDVG